ncbi:MAG: TipAS antibiotic-recognition domain-containing protein [Thermomicrobiales bacterium]
MDWSIQEVARMSGITSRTLRHYGDTGLLPPSRTGTNGQRHYNREALIRLQRILLLRELGLGLKAIGEVLEQQVDTEAALYQHLEWLRRERKRLGEQIRSLETTMASLNGEQGIMPTEMFRGFDHTEYRDEVVERWGEDAWNSSNAWWSTLTEDEKQAFQREQESIAADFGAAWVKGLAPDCNAVQAITQRHFEWMSHSGKPDREYFMGLGQMYVDDPRFTANYDRHGTGTAVFIRDAMLVFAEREL